MKPPVFEYFRPETLDEAVGLLDRYSGDAKVLAGGQSLIPLMNFRLARPEYVVDINAISDLEYIREEDGVITIGAMTRQCTIERSELLAGKCPLLVETTKLIGHSSIRHKGTIGGSIAHADPAAEYPAALVALDAAVKVVGSDGARIMPAGELFLTYCTTTLAPNEIITEIRVPIPATAGGWAFEELTRRHGDFAIVGVAALVQVEDGVCHEARIALAGVGPTPIRCNDAEAALEGNPLNDEALEHAGALASAAAQPEDDVHASASYKQAMVAVFVQRALRRARERAGRERDATQY